MFRWLDDKKTYIDLVADGALLATTFFLAKENSNN